MSNNLDIYLEDFKYIESKKYIKWEKLKNKTIFITGSTGLIGFNLINTLLHLNRIRGLNVKILALVRDEEKAMSRFEIERDSDLKLQFIVGNVENLPNITDAIDYIIHGASNTASKDFVAKPTETIHTAVMGTTNLLELAKKNKIKCFIYLSSMEVYGSPQKGHKIREDEIGTFNPHIIRNCYPIGKILCESICNAYASEYSLPIKILRLTQTFGPGIIDDDNRIFAEFARCAVEERDITLFSEGKTERCYLYTADAVTAIYTLLLNEIEEKCNTYNVANEKNYCSISEMANIVAKISNIKVNYNTKNIEEKGYADTVYIDLDTSRLQSIGWEAEINLENAYRRMINYLIEKRNR